MNVINTQVEPTTVWISDQCKDTPGGCTKVVRGLVVEAVGVQAAALCGGGVVVEYLWKHMKYNFRMLCNIVARPECSGVRIVVGKR